MLLLCITVTSCKKDVSTTEGLPHQVPQLELIGENPSPYSDAEVLQMADDMLANVSYIGAEHWYKEPSYESILSEADYQTIYRACVENNIPFSDSLLRQNLPIGQPCSNSKEERKQNFLSALPAYRSEGNHIEAFVIRTGRPAVRDANASSLAEAFASFGDNYGPASAISYDYNRTGASDGRILSLDLVLATQAFNSTTTDALVEFEPDCIDYENAIQFSGNWYMITLTCPIFINGVEYGPFDWSNPLFYNPTIANETFDDCGQLTSWIDGKVVGPIGGGITEIDVYGVIQMGQPFPCE